MESNWKHLLPILLCAFAFPSCYKAIAKKIKNDIELEVIRDYTIGYDTDSVDIGLGQVFDSLLPVEQTLNIILTHGIGKPEEKHFKGFKELLVKGLLSKEKDPTAGPSKMKLANEPLLKSMGIDPPSVEVSSYDIRNKKVVIYEVDWSPVTSSAKDLLKVNLDKNPHRTTLTTLAKQEILIDALGDLSLYLSDYYKDLIQGPFIELLNYLGAQAEGDKTVFIGGSTGNEIFLDALSKVEPGDGLDLCRIYMLSNQLPFTAQLSMAGTTGDQDKVYVKYLYERLINYKEKNAEKMPHVISFYDPNDVFGYKLPRPEKYGIQGLTVHNVKVHNTLEWSFNPEKLRNKYLANLDEDAKNAILENLHQHTNRQNIKIDLGKTNKSAKLNLAIIGGIIKGSGYGATNFNSSFKLISYSSNGKKVKSAKVKIGEKKHKFPKQKQNFFLERQVAKWANNQIEKAGVSRGIQLPYEYPSFNLYTDATKVTGIEESVKNNKITNVVTMHGMRSKEAGHFDTMVNGIAKQLNFNTETRTEICSIPSVGGAASQSPSIFLREYANEAGKRLRFFIVYWSPVTMPTKITLRQLEATYLPNEDHSFVIELLKKAIVNDGFSDIPLSAKGLKPNIHELLDMTFDLLLLNDPFQPESPHNKLVNGDSAQKNNYFITSSLGSGLMMDYLIEKMKLGSENPNVAKVLQSTDQIFMLTNQLPILALKNLEGPINSCDEFIEHIYGNWDKKSCPPLKIVAFNDPNDVLGFRLPVPASNSKITVQNISLNIADGYQINKYYTFKLIKKMDRVFKKMIDKDELKVQRNRILDEAKSGVESKFWKKACIKEMDLKKREYDNLVSNVAFSFLEKFEAGQDPLQKFVIRVDNAHEAPSENERIFNILAYGTRNISKTRTEELPPPGCK